MRLLGRKDNMFYYKRNTMAEKERWHKWFAWHPVTVSKTKDRDSKKIWLEYVYRCGDYWCNFAGSGWDWEYKEMP